MLNIAVCTARKAGSLVVKHYEMPDTVETSQKGSSDFVTNVGKTTEAIIIKTIRRSYPQHTIIIKESSKHTNEEQNVQRVTNPLDGTTNFIERLPYFSVSIAVHIRGRTEVAVVHDPMRNELFTAIHGQGTQLNGYRPHDNSARDLDGTITVVGFPFRAKRHATTYMDILNNMFTECADFRRAGSITLNLVYIVAGHINGYFEVALGPWGSTADKLAAREADAIVCDLTGGHSYLLTGNTVTGNPRVVKVMLANMREQLSDALKR